MASTDRIRRAEQELHGLSLLIDGRHARDGTLTWTMIADTVEMVWRLLRAELDGVSDPARLVTPIQQKTAHNTEMAQLADIASDLEARLRCLSGRGGSVPGPLRDATSENLGVMSS